MQVKPICLNLVQFVFRNKLSIRKPCSNWTMFPILLYDQKRTPNHGNLKMLFGRYAHYELKVHNASRPIL